MSSVFSPITFKSVTLKNRLVVSPMCQYSSIDGFANDWHLVHLGSRAVGGAGLILAEATAVSPEGRITPNDLGLWKEEHISFLKRITQFIEAQGSVAGIQLAHAGRKASHESPWKGGQVLTDERAWQTVAPSAIPFKEGEPVPDELSADAITKIKTDFKEAAARALQAGFKLVEIHAAHGYLLHQFLSPLSNTRADAYGGSIHNRTRLLLEVVSEVQTVWPAELPLFVRISATDWVEDGWKLDDSIELATRLRTAGVDLIDCSSGGSVPKAKIPVAPLYQLPFATAIKQKAGIRTGAVGMITTAQQADEIIKKDEADLVFIGREFLRNPYFTLEAAHQLGQSVDWPSQYERAKW